MFCKVREKMAAVMDASPRVALLGIWMLAGICVGFVVSICLFGICVWLIILPVESFKLMVMFAVWLGPWLLMDSWTAIVFPG